MARCGRAVARAPACPHLPLGTGRGRRDGHAALQRHSSSGPGERLVLSTAGRSPWDGVGQLLSTLCIAHCVLLPVVLGFLPAATAEVLEGEAVHQGLVLFVTLTAVVAFVPGWRLHRRAGVPVLAVSGLLLLVAALFLPEGTSEALETGLTLGGGVLMAVAHARNRTLCRECCALKLGTA
ncbi:MerC domain-containing protein [Archangium violaceum]|nr:MerC domain-containing protein [Archangium violaceum]